MSPGTCNACSPQPSARPAWWRVRGAGVRFVALGALLAATAAAGLGHAASAPRWSPDVQLTFAAAPSHTSYNFARSIAADPAGRVFVVWFRQDRGVSQVFLKRSRDGGVSWGAALPLSRSSRGAAYPAIALAGAAVLKAPVASSAATGSADRRTQAW